MLKKHRIKKTKGSLTGNVRYSIQYKYLLFPFFWFFIKTDHFGKLKIAEYSAKEDAIAAIKDLCEKKVVSYHEIPKI